MAITQAARGSADSAVRQAAALGLPPDALMRIAESLEVQGAPEAAAEMYAAVVARPDTASGLRLELGLRAAETDVAVGRPDAARAVLEAALQGQRGPQELAERAAFLLADLDLAAGRDLAGARAALAEIVERSAQPDLARRARWRLADVAFAQGDYPAAEPQYQALAAEAPSLELELPPPPPGLMPLRNGLFLPPGFDPGDAPRTDPRTTPAYAAFQLAECAFRRADFDRAKALFAGVSEAFPDSVYANDAVDRRLFIATHFSNPRPATEAYLAALSRCFTDDWPAAAESLRGLAAAGVMEPLSDDAALQLATLLEAHGKPAEAAAEYRALPDTFPGSLLSPEALLRAARLARSLGDEAHAREDLDRLLRNYPTAPMAKTAALWLDDLQQGRPWPAQ
jgi:TolA-binding protein